MFNKFRKDLPPIDIRMKEVKTIFGNKKLVPATKREQRAMKNELMKIYPDRYFIDDLYDKNSIKGETYIDEFEKYDAIFDDEF